MFMYRIAFTGHRPNKLGGYDWNTAENIQNMENLKDAILKVMKASGDSEFSFYFGGALGVDQMAFEVVSEIQKTFHNFRILKTICIPFAKQDSAWVDSSKVIYHKQLKEAEALVYVDNLPKYQISSIPMGEYHPAKMQKRNEYMVDNCDILIAVYNGDEKGGTANCVKYAKKIGKEIFVVNPVCKK